jgi:hypothetical protein
MTSFSYRDKRIFVNGTPMDADLRNDPDATLLHSLSHCDRRVFAGLISRDGLAWAQDELFESDSVAALRLMEALAADSERRASLGDVFASSRLLQVSTARIVLHARGLTGDMSDLAGDILLDDPRPSRLRAVVRTARQRWVALVLDPSVAKPASFVKDLDTTLDTVFHRGQGLPLIADVLENPDRERQETAAVLAVLKRLRLTRFDLIGYYGDVGCSGRVSRPVLALFVAIPGASILLGAFLAGGLSHAIWGAMLAIGGILFAFAISSYRDEVTPLLCLRLPASASVGAAAVMSFGAKWMQSVELGRAVLLGSGLLVVTFAYILNEARAHGLQGRKLFIRSAVLLLLGVLYATTIAMVAIAFLLPTLVPDEGLPASAHVGPSIIVFAAASLTLGLIVQVLWDSQPIVAPLSHADRVVEVDA